MTAAPQVDLTNCDREPIHIPGAIQPHGVLLAFDEAGRLVSFSLNAATHLGRLPALGEALSNEHLTERLRAGVLEALANPRRPLEPFEVEVQRQTFDALLHRSGGLLVVELELRAAGSPPLERFALTAQRAITRIQAETDLDQLLQVAAVEIRALTGFDRVMAYRFQHDDSGLVAAEAKRDDLEPFLGLRYPASDIPVQARRLYTLNPLRLIADIGYLPVPLTPAVVPPLNKPLDLSFSVLRSVSPVHVEYLKNMGVRASMSISIVVHGKLWGLFACHHMTPRLVPHAVRMACNLLSQIAGVLVERAQMALSSVALERALSVQTALLHRAVLSTEVPAALIEAPGVAQLFESDGAVAMLASDIAAKGHVPGDEAVRALARVLAARAEDVFHTHRLSVELPEIAALMPRVCGVLAVRFFKEQGGFVFWFRGEEIQTVRWAGNPDKQYDEGPLGSRLSPRGSFAEWRETVTNAARPFTVAEMQVAIQLRRELQDLLLTRARARIQSLEHSNEELDRLAYVASHDLRAPLRAIASLSEFIEEDLQSVLTADAKKNLHLLRQRVVRLDELLHSILDYSRSGRARGMAQPIDVRALVAEVVAMLAPDEETVRISLRDPVPTVTGDPTFLKQIFLNLIANALVHGVKGGRVALEIAVTDRGAFHEISVADRGPGLAPRHHARIFEIFSRVSDDNKGSGIGLAVVRRLVEAQGGKVWLESVEGEGATFRFTLPKAPLS